MKKLSIGLPILALVIAAAASAFTTKKTANVWYTFESQNYSQVTDLTKYQNTHSSTSPGCGTDGNVCAILLPDSNQDDPNSSDFSSLQSAISSSQQSGRSTDPRIQMFQ